MNGTITSRLEVLLSKIAGEDISLNTMTPPVAMNKTEKLLLKIAERLDGFADRSDGGSVTVFEVTGTVSSNEQNKVIVTTNRTAEEWYNAAMSGAVLHLSAGNGNMAPDMVVPFEVIRATIDGSVVYSIKARIDTTPDDKLLVSGMLSGSDIVVVTEV